MSSQTTTQELHSPMFDIPSLLQCLLPQINATTMRQLNQIILAMLAMSGRVTMLGRMALRKALSYAG
ncbi:hypothetical protein [Nostoc sp.]|uniref:hypothetical protein n=1 Tax=Nostoc sp. TaxID=1180 RepID=UPI003FA55D09